MSSIIISGGPGSGKTTLLEALKKKGFHCSDEISRQLIQEQVALNSECLPWKNLSSFADLALERMLEAYEKASFSAKITFFDRAIPDIIGYLNVGGLPVDKKFHRILKSHPYHQHVFMAPPWEAIYINDDERWQTFDEATTLHNALVQTYLAAGYKIIQLPFSSVAERVGFVLEKLEQFSLPAYEHQNYLPKS